MKVVFHVNETSHYESALSNIKNILKHDIESVILLINGEAITLFKDASKMPALDDSRFTINACQNSMRAHNIEEGDLFPKTTSVASGVYTLTQLQTNGYAYIKP